MSLRFKAGLFVAVGVLVSALALVMKPSIIGTLVAADAPAQAATNKADASADEKAIRATADDFVKAFNAGDAKAVGALWSDDAEYTDESGESHHGRAAIEKLYAGLFKEQPGGLMTVNVESVRLLGPDIAVEKGISKLKAASGQTSAARYTVVHARRNGKWIMVDCRDAPYVAGANDDYLKDLEFLIGDWTIEAKDEARHIKFEWMCRRNFVKCSFTAIKDGKTTLEGGQVIGWNPRLAKIVSMHYDANGGFGNDVWIKDGAKWVLEAKGVFRDGSDSAAVNIITPIDAKSFTWQSVKRTLDGVRLPDMPPVRVVRAKASS